MSFKRLADHVSISVCFDHLRLFLKMIHKRNVLGSESRWRACSSFSNYARGLAITLEFVCDVFSFFFFSRVFCASKGQTQCCFSGAACQHESLSSGAEKCIQSMSKVTNTALPLTVCRKQEGSYTCKIQAEILVEHGESLQEAAVTFHRSNLQNASSSIWLRSENQSLKLYVSATAVGSDKSC